MLLPHFVLKVFKFQSCNSAGSRPWGPGHPDHPDPHMGGGGGGLRPQFNLKMRGAGRLPGPLPWIGRSVIILSFLSGGM